MWINAETVDSVIEKSQGWSLARERRGKIEADRKKTEEEREMKCEDIEIAVARFFNIRMNLSVPNISWGMGLHECDLLICTVRDYFIEVEIKVSKADLKADKKKNHHHFSTKIRRLYFALPKKMLEKDGVEELIPSWAGIISVGESEVGNYTKIERKAKINPNAMPLTLTEKYEFARLGTLRIWDLKQRLQKIRQAIT